MMRKNSVTEDFVHLPHPADAKFRARGSTLEEAFLNSARAMVALMWDCREMAMTTEIPVEIAGRSREQLLVKFLSEILYLLDARGFLMCSADGLSIVEDRRETKNGDGFPDVSTPGYRLQALLRGDGLSSGAEIFGSVKAVTYHELKIERADTGEWTVEVVVDA